MRAEYLCLRLSFIHFAISSGGFYLLAHLLSVKLIPDGINATEIGLRTSLFPKWNSKGAEVHPNHPYLPCSYAYMRVSHEL